MQIKRYYVIEYKGRTIDITRDALLLGPMPILWCNDGMYAIIPGAILEELFEYPAPSKPDELPHISNSMQQIYWEQAYELKLDVGRLLCDRNYNGG